MNITFSEFKEEDKADLVSLAYKLEEYQKEIDPIGRVQNQKGFSELDVEGTLEDIRNNKGKIYFALEDKTKIGFAVGVIWNQSERSRLEIGNHKVGEVIHLYVEKDYRGKGVGRELLGKIEEYFMLEGCDSVWLSVFSPNVKAHALYEKSGYVDREVGMLKELKSGTS